MMPIVITTLVHMALEMLLPIGTVAKIYAFKDEDKMLSILIYLLDIVTIIATVINILKP